MGCVDEDRGWLLGFFETQTKKRNLIMNEQTKKISVVEWGIALAIIASVAYIITNSLMSSEIPISQVLKYGSLFVAFFFVPLFLIFGIHYWVLGRILHNPYPFEHFKLGYFGPKSQNPSNQEKTLHTIRFYTLSIFASTFALIPLRYLLQKINTTKFLWDAATYSLFSQLLIDWLFIAPGITIILLIFSQKILGKPIKEAWKAILTAGIATATFAGFYALFFNHFVLPLMGM